MIFAGIVILPTMSEYKISRNALVGIAVSLVLYSLYLPYQNGQLQDALQLERSRRYFEKIRPYKLGFISVVCAYYEGEIDAANAEAKVTRTLKTYVSRKLDTVNVNEIKSEIDKQIGLTAQITVSDTPSYYNY